MNKVLLQVWEESNKKEGIRQDGCSLHIDESNRKSYIKNIYKNRNVNVVSSSYQRIVGDASYVTLSIELYNKLKKSKSIRLMRYEMNNLLDVEEIIVED